MCDNITVDTDKWKEIFYTNFHITSQENIPTAENPTQSSDLFGFDNILWKVDGMQIHWIGSINMQMFALNQSYIFIIVYLWWINNFLWSILLDFESEMLLLTPTT